MYKLRLTLRRGENVRYISHLDLLRTLTRALRRSGLPLKYSEGFNPHPVMTFALPLSVGVTSDCEVVDVGLAQEIDLMDELKRISAALPEGLEIAEGRVTEQKMPKVVRAGYRVLARLSGEFAPELESRVQETLRGESLPVEKKSKKKLETIDVLKHLYNFTIERTEPDELIVQLTVDAGNTFNLKPELVFQAISAKVPEFEPKYLEIHREALEFN